MSTIFPPKYASFEEKETIFIENRKIEPSVSLQKVSL